MRHIIGKTDDGKKLVLSDRFVDRLFVNGHPAQEGTTFLIRGIEYRLTKSIVEDLVDDKFGPLPMNNGCPTHYLELVPTNSGVRPITIATYDHWSDENDFQVSSIH